MVGHLHQLSARRRRRPSAAEGRSFPIKSRILALLTVVLTIVSALAGCASGPNGTNSVSTAPVLTASSPTPSPDATATAGSPTPTPTTPTFIQFALSINDEGSFDSANGFYAIMLNAFDTPIDVTNNDKFTDFMQWDGTYMIWYHRQALPGNNLYNFVAAATLNQNVSLSEDRHTLIVTFKTTETTNPFSQFITTNAFTANCATTDRQGILGRIIDTMGPGPSLDNDALYTYSIDKTLGLLFPAPPEYPNDRLNDWVTQPDAGTNFPYVNFDIKRFEVTVH